ncbi:uncharacterized protein [Chironomus tepperi]|uniref:uncharacterized protein n=1 Tax=Chironomus tepperi TaxID=113505 RepID=UPI00391F40A9
MDFQMNERKNDVENQLLQSEEEKLEKMRQEKYFKYKNDLKNYEYKETNGKSIILKIYPSMFSKNRKEISKFEKILTSSGDNSAIISMVLRKFENEEFLTKKIDLKFVMGKHMADEAHIMNLFSFLMFDWHDQSVHNRSYNLIQKFKAYKEVCPSSKSLFDKIFQILNAEDHNVYHVICMKIIFYYFEEFFSEEKNTEEVMSETKNIQDLIRKVVQIKDSEYKIQILKILYANLPNTKDPEYKSLIDKIKQVVKFDFHYLSVCKISYAAITKHCDERFFNLLYLLKDNLVVKFKLELEEFIEINKKFYGEYWTHAIKTNARIFYQTAKNQGLIETQEFILINIPNVDIKAPVTTMFTELSECYAIFNEPLESGEQLILKYIHTFIDKMPESISINTDNFKKLLKNTNNVKKLVFGRQNFNSESFFEKFWSINDKKRSDVEFLECANHIWNEFRLWEKPEILTMKNPLNKNIFNYVLNTNNNRHIMSFLMPKFEKDNGNKSIHKLKHYMVLKNSLLYDCSQYNDYKCLIDFHFKLIEKNMGEDPYNLDNLFYMFEEIGFYSMEQEFKNEFIRELFEKIMNEEVTNEEIMNEEIMNEEKEKHDGRMKYELKLPRKHFLIGIMMIYWKEEGKDLVEKFEIGSQTSIEQDEVCNKNLYFGLLSMIMNKEDKTFLKEYKTELKRIESCFKYTYNLESTYDNDHERADDDNIFHLYEKYSTNFNFVLLYAAIKTNQTVIVDEIFKYNNFLISCPLFPINMEPDEIHYHTAVKFLESRYELERNDLPDNWIRHHNMKKFLDSRISSQNDFYKIDCRFMLPYYNFEENKIIDEHMENDEDLLLNEDYGSMEYIIEHHGLKSLVAHPVMETIINLKIQKYDRILFWNFLGFVFFYIIPTIFLTYFLHSKTLPGNTNGTITSNNDTSSNIQDTTISPNDETYILEHIINAIRFVYIFLRELFQFQVYGKDYLKCRSNYVEFFLILLPIILSGGIEVLSYFQYEKMFVFIGVVEAINILIMIVATALLYSTPKFSAHLRCYKKITLSYMSVFLNFFPLFIGLAGLTFILFDQKVDGEKPKIFQTLDGSLMKLIVMYSGEIGIEPDDITLFLQRMTIALIIIILINKSNLIISIAVNDIHTLMQESRQLSLIDNADKYVFFAKKLRIFFANNEDETTRGKSTRFFLWLIKIFINKYPYIHRLQSIYIDKRTYKVFIDSDIKAQQLISNASFWTRWFDKLWVSILGMFKASSESIENIHAILAETRHQNIYLYNCNNVEGNNLENHDLNRSYYGGSANNVRSYNMIRQNLD